MLVIIIAACLAFAAAFLILLSSAGRLPVLNGGAAAQTASASDKNIYIRQMAELKRQEAYGLLDADSAKEARLELARRILAAEKTQQREAAPACPHSRAFALFLSAAVLFIPLFCGAVYAYQGRPDEAETYFADFMARDPKTMTEAENIVRLEALSARAPREPAYADALGALYMQTGRFQDAANTYNKALSLGGENAGRLLGYAIALTGFNDGIVENDAEAAFRNVLRLDPQNLQAQLFLARGLLQGGKKSEALALLEEFLLKAPPGSADRANLQTAIAALQRHDAAGAPAKTLPQAGGLSAAQKQFIRDNLGKLVLRLRQQPQNAQAWAMLINAYLLLEERAKAAAALAQAAAALPAKEAAALKAAAARRGLGAPHETQP